MTAPRTDDDLGAALRAALQTLSPLATDPLPPPRFAPTALLDAAPPPATTAVDAGELVENGAPATVTPLRRRRVTVAAALLAVAAAAVVVAVTTTDLGGRPDPERSAAPAGPGSVAPSPLPTVPDRGGADLGVTPDPFPWRCTAPRGTTIAVVQDADQIRPSVWNVAPGVTCAPVPADENRFQFGDDGDTVSFTGDAVAVQGGFGDYCAYAATQSPPGGRLSFVSQGAADYLEFAGPGCRLVLPSR